MSRRKKAAPFFFGLILLTFLTCGIREDELRCEEAVARLVQCCPGFQAQQLDCYYTATSCGTITPALGIQDSRCIGSTSCEVLVNSGVCSRAQRATPYSSERVCP